MSQAARPSSASSSSRRRVNHPSAPVAPVAVPARRSSRKRVATDAESSATPTDGDAPAAASVPQDQRKSRRTSARNSASSSTTSAPPIASGVETSPAAPTQETSQLRRGTRSSGTLSTPSTASTSIAAPKPAKRKRDSKKDITQLKKKEEEPEQIEDSSEDHPPQKRRSTRISNARNNTATDSKNLPAAKPRKTVRMADVPPPSVEAKPLRKSSSKSAKSASSSSNSNAAAAGRVTKRGSMDSKKSASSMASQSSKSSKHSRRDSPTKKKATHSEDDEDDQDDDDDEDEEDNDGGVAIPSSSGGGANPRSSFGGGSFGFFGSGTGAAAPGAGQFREMLTQLNSTGNVGVQMMALQDLMEILSVATEDMFVGSGSSRLVGFSTEEFVKALLGILKNAGSASGNPSIPSDFPVDFMDEADLQAMGFGGGGDAMTADLMLLSCRCLLNLIEAHPSSTAVIVSMNGPSILVSKIMEIEYIDLAEVALSVLERIAGDFPSIVVKSNGMFAAVQFVDFFGIHVQRTAVGIVNAAARGLPSNIADPAAASSVEETFKMVESVVPILTTLVTHSDSRLVDNAVSALSRIVEWAAKSEKHLERLVTPSTLDTIIAQLNSAVLSAATTSGSAGTPVSSGGAAASSTNLSALGGSVFVMFVRILSSVCRGSATLGASCVREKGVLNILFGILTGGARTEEIGLASAVTSVVLNYGVEMLMLVITLAVEVLPALPKSPDGTWSMRQGITCSPTASSPKKSKSTTTNKRKSKKSEDDEHTSPAIETIDERRLRLLGEHTSDHAQLLLPCLIEISAVTASPALRRRCLDAVARSIQYCASVQVLSKAIAGGNGGVSLGRVVADLLEPWRVAVVEQWDRDKALLVVAGVQLCSVVADRCGVKVVEDVFAREGVIGALRSMVEAIKASAAESSRSRSASPARASGDVGEVAKDLELVREKIADHIEDEESDEDEDDGGEKKKLEDVQDIKKLLEEAGKIVADADGAQSGATSEQAAAAPSSSSERFSMMSAMRTALEKLRRTANTLGVPLGSSSAEREKDRKLSATSLTGLNGERCTEEEAKEWLIGACDRIIAISPADGASHVLAELRSLAKSFRDEVPSTPSLTETVKGQVAVVVSPTTDSAADPLKLNALSAVARLFAAPEGVTGFEMLESGIVDALASYLTTPGPGETLPDARRTVSAVKSKVPLMTRLRAFLHVFLNAPLVLVPGNSDNEKPSPVAVTHYVPGAFVALVSRLQESLSRFEQFDIALAVPPTSSSSSQDNPTSFLNFFSSLFGRDLPSSLSAAAANSAHPSVQLAKQVRIRLVAEQPDTVPEGFKSVVVGILAIATVKSLEDYLKGKVGGLEDESKKETEENEEAVDKSGGEEKLNDEDDEHDHDDEDEHDYDDDDDGEEELEVNVSELLLESEEQQRAKRRGLRTSGASGGMSPSDASLRESVVDVRADFTPSSPSPLASGAAASLPRSLAGGRATSATPSSPTARPIGAPAPASRQLSIVFSVDDTVAAPDQTIFSLLYKHELKKKGDAAQPNIWPSVFTVKYRKVFEPAVADLVVKPEEARNSEEMKDAEDPMDIEMKGDIGETEEGKDGLLQVRLPFPTSVSPAVGSTVAGNIMFLLRLLHALNSRWSEVLEEHVQAVSTSSAMAVLGPAVAAEGPAESSRSVFLTPLPSSEFLNNKLTAKLNRQLDEPLIVACGCLPNWAAALPRDFSFLVPFETRLIYLQSTAFGFSRSLGRWQQPGASGGASARSSRSGGNGGDRAVVGAIARQKVRIARNRIVDSMSRVMDLYGASQTLLEVEFFDEVGTGLGPTLEFYSIVCRELRKREGVAVSARVAPPLASASKSALTAGLLAATAATSVETVRLWRSDGVDVSSTEVSDDAKTFLNPKEGLFPAPISLATLASETGRRIIGVFHALGIFIGKALLDSRIIDMPFSLALIEMVVGNQHDSSDRSARLLAELHMLQHVDKTMHSSLIDLRKYVAAKHAIEDASDLSETERTSRVAQVTVRNARIEDLCLDFTLPGYPDIELVPSGKDITVTMENLEDYIDKVVDLTVGSGVRAQIDAMRAGFDRVFPVADLRIFSTEELSVLLGGNSEEDWSLETIIDSIKADHGYTAGSKIIRYLAEMMNSLSPSERREFLTFVTGSPKLPIGGFKALSPPLTVVCKKDTEGVGRGAVDEYLPSVMTCVNYLKVPEYSSLEILVKRFRIAMTEGQGCFHLS